MSNTYHELLPGTPEYKKAIIQSLLDNDKNALNMIKSNYGLPIHVVNNWFAYGLIYGQNDNSAIVILNHETKKDLTRFEESIKNHG